MQYHVLYITVLYAHGAFSLTPFCLGVSYPNCSYPRSAEPGSLASWMAALPPVHTPAHTVAMRPREEHVLSSIGGEVKLSSDSYWPSIERSS
ncbi:hypothetical protein F5Y06DRAFT_152047 [Hypoxylon sp. FL0890]|nr:hypothetical protein F5Y06DRAFT_152047 [Hypoxylon sp. FL0890]